MEKEIEAETFFDVISEEEIKKLLDVGFSREQAEVLINMMRQKAFSGGFL